MLIAKIDILPLQAPLIYPFRTTFGQHDTLDNLLVRIKLDNGLVGLGEAAIAPHITGETVAKTKRNLKKFSGELLGLDAQDYLEISRRLRKGLSDNRAAVAALEMALLDAFTKAKGIPLWRLFGKKTTRIATDITIVIASLKETRAAARKFYRQGFRSFKIKIGRDRDLDFKRVLAVRQGVRQSQILLDANQGYTARQTIKFLKDLARLDIHPALIEQPVAKNDLEGLKEIRLAKLAPVCADESVRNLADCQRLIRREAVDVINIKLMKSGFFESREIIRLAKASRLKLMLGGMMESILAMTAAAHFAAGLKCFDFIDLDPPFFIKGELGRSPYLNPRGVYDVAKVKAGIGIKVSYP